MHLNKLIVRCRVGDRCEMKNRVEPLVPELFAPIERRQVLRNEIAAISSEIFEITRAEIVDHRQSRIGKFLLQRKCEIGADETGSAGDDQIRRRIQ